MHSAIPLWPEAHLSWEAAWGSLLISSLEIYCISNDRRLYSLFLFAKNLQGQGYWFSFQMMETQYLDDMSADIIHTLCIFRAPITLYSSILEKLSRDTYH